jgi:predicted ATPase
MPLVETSQRQLLLTPPVAHVRVRATLLHWETTKAEAYFERALSVAREQQAKSWELRAAMNLARHWRDQGKPQQARELLVPVYGCLRVVY